MLVKQLCSVKYWQIEKHLLTYATAVYIHFVRSLSDG